MGRASPYRGFAVDCRESAALSADGAAGLCRARPGAVGVDTTACLAGTGHPFGYLTQAQIEQYGGRDEMRTVATYHPAQEMMLVLLKLQGRVRTYRVGIPPRIRL